MKINVKCLYNNYCIYTVLVYLHRDATLVVLAINVFLGWPVSLSLT